ncbi:MAG TPA: SHOCT domain-containing protein [Longimicrobiales bacterium]|nr:SHOCT domain-containing protein [Longimicrobiales bacterium]
MTTLATAAQRWCPWCGDHMGWGGWAMMLFWLIVLLVVLGVVWAAATGRWRGGTRDARDPAEEKLRAQFARGEIDEETYRRRLEELRRS